MTEPFLIESDRSRAEQAASVDDEGAPTGDFVGTIEANPVDVFEQQRSVPFDEEDQLSG